MDRHQEDEVSASDAESGPARGRTGRPPRDIGVGGSVGLVVAAVLLAACGQQPPPSAPEPAPRTAPSSTGMSVPQADALTRVVELAARRAAVSDRVAAAKLGTGQPVTDPVREAAVLATARDAAARSGVDPEWVARVFDDQIAASTQVQNDRLRTWAENPAARPAERPDLARIRPELDRIGEELVAALKAAAPARGHQACSATLADVVATQAGHVDPVHRSALDRALLSVCDGAQG